MNTAIETTEGRVIIGRITEETPDEGRDSPESTRAGNRHDQEVGD